MYGAVRLDNISSARRSFRMSERAGPRQGLNTRRVSGNRSSSDSIVLRFPVIPAEAIAIRCR